MQHNDEIHLLGEYPSAPGPKESWAVVRGCSCRIGIGHLDILR